MTLKFGLLGAGRIGKVHAKAVGANAGARLVAVADAFPDAAAAIADQYGCAVRSIEAIATSADIDAVIVCTPTDTHADLIEQFTRADKAVFCEKPIALDIGRVKACLEVVAAANGVLMVGFNRRFDPHFMALRDAVFGGEIGTVEQVQITSRDPGPPPPDYISRSGGIFSDMTIHDFDMARFLLDEEPVSVYATASVLVDEQIGALGDYDTAMLVLETASGRQAMITNSRRATYGYDQRIEVHGSSGMIGAENQRAVSIEIANVKGFTRPPLLDFFMTRYTEAYANEIAHFIAAVSDGAPASPTGGDGLAALVLAEAARRSVKQGRKVMVSEVAG